jgi:hypothetical protein
MTVMTALPTTLLKPVVRFREFPFGTAKDPSMRRSGLILGVTMGADLQDFIDRSRNANPIINGRPEGGTTEMTDGVWFWFAGLIWFIEHYNLRVPEEFIHHAARNNWHVDRERIPPAHYDCTYFGST